MKRCIILFIFLLIPVFLIFAEDAQPAEGLYERTVAADIQSSAYHELAEWCRRLNLPDDGTGQVLRSRLYSYYDVKAPSENQTDNSRKKKITIERADNLDYFTIEKVDENYAAITGDVYLKLEDQEKNETHIIRADTILFNFEQNTITASGNIRYTLEGETKTENFSGEKLTFSIDDSAGLFDKGVTEQEKTINEGTEDAEEITFYFKGDLINKTEENYVVLEDGQITSCDFDDPHFKIKAKKLWLITSNEWAILNGVVHIGRVPVFYFPAFIYGGDDMFFNPVFGYMNDFGGYLQTTTYLIGRKAEDPDTAFSFMQTDSEYNYLKREGLFLTKDEHPSTQQKALQDYGRDSKNYLKILLDYYTVLGLYSAIDMKLEKTSGSEKEAFPGFINSILSVFTRNELYVSAARTRKIENISGLYTALFPDDEGVYRSKWHRSYLFRTELPFRYGYDYSTSAELGWFDLDLSMNGYSDRSYTEDFFKRSENLDLLSFLDKQDESDTSGSETTSTKWDADLKFSPELKIFNPYINQLNLTAETTLSFNSREIDSTDETYDDAVDFFFYPESFDLPVLSMSLGGSILPVKTAASDSNDGVKDHEGALELSPPWSDSEKVEADASEIEGIPEPAPDIEIDLGNYWSDTELFSNKLTYSFTPKYSDRTQLGTGEWKTPEDISFETIDYSYRSVSLNGNLKYSVNVFDSLFDIDNTLSGNWDFNEHYNMELLSEETSEKYRDDDNQANDALIKNNLAVSTSPLVYLDFFSKTRITYSFNSILYKYDYSTDDSQYFTEYFKADEDFITAHSLNFNFPTEIGGLGQTLNIKTSLPPVSLTTSGSYKLVYGISSSEFNTSFSETDDGFEFEPLSFNEKLTLGSSSVTNNIAYNYSEKYFEKNTTDLKLSFLDGNLTSSSNFTYDILNKSIDNLSFDLGLYAFKYNFTAKNTSDYTFNIESGSWIQSEEQEFIPYSMKFSLNSDDVKFKLWKNRVEFDLNLDTALNMDMIRFTESDLSLKLGFSLKIYKFMDFTLETSSVNTSIYRYFPELCSQTGMNRINPAEDLLKSFNFFNVDDRYESNFNLQSIKVGLNHDMHDWDLNLTYTGKPYVNKEGDFPVYDWENSLSIYLKWKSIPDIKSEVEIDNDGVSF